MANQEVDRSKRRFLVAATSVAGGVAAAAVAVPFISSMLPSERANIYFFTIALVNKLAVKFANCLFIDC